MITIEEIWVVLTLSWSALRLIQNEKNQSLCKNFYSRYISAPLNQTYSSIEKCFSFIKNKQNIHAFGFKWFTCNAVIDVCLVIYDYKVRYK